jgi:hypothetical protein
MPFKWFKREVPKRRLLTEEEYSRQRDIETEKSLDELRQFCRSPKCNPWKTMSALKDPLRFARFVEGESHLTDLELTVYETSFYDDGPPSNEREHVLTDDEELEEDDSNGSGHGLNPDEVDSPFLRVIGGHYVAS